MREYYNKDEMANLKVKIKPLVNPFEKQANPKTMSDLFFTKDAKIAIEKFEVRRKE